MNPAILDMDATTLAARIRDGSMTSVDATDAFIKHLQHVNPTLNCLVEDRFVAARDEARRADVLATQGRTGGRLHGVPISMKEAFDVAGMKTTGGLLHRRNHRAEKDASAVARLKQEGAIILGKTNTPTLCFCQETDNKLYGRSNNPWDLDCTTGGSSGGEAALIAVGGAAVGFGSDIGGSIRFPAHFNGVIGFRSGARQVSQQGHFPFVDDPYQERMLGMGALAKSVADAELINAIVADAQPRDVDFDAFNMIIPPVDRRFPMDAPTAELLDGVRKFLASEKQVEEDPPPFFDKAALWWQLAMAADGGAGIARLAFNDHKPRPVAAFLREVLRHDASIHRFLSWTLIGTAMFRPSHAKWARLIDELHEADDAMARYLKNRVLVMPVYHTASRPHGQIYAEIFSIRRTFLRVMPYVAMVNIFGLPALTVPVGRDRRGLPIAVQLVSAVGNEQALFQAGRMLEKGFGGVKRCTAHDAVI